MVGVQGRPVKRPRLDVFKRGSLVKIRVHNFMTYCDAEIEAGPKLNLLLGPNGTGKSSFVCAICVGLAGSTSLLGRADDTQEFVRRGENEGWTEITLAGGPGQRDIVITRKLKNRSDGSGVSEWQINGRPSKKQEVVEKVKELHVQLENLCQFLPQDKVVSFAQLNPTDLLAETQKAVGDSTLHQQHVKLIAVRQDYKLKEQANQATNTQLDGLRQDNNAVERDVRRFQEREKLTELVELMEQYLPYRNFSEQLEKFNEGKKRLQEFKQTLASKSAELEESLGPYKEKKKKAVAAAKAAQALKNQLTRVDAEITAGKFVDTIEELSAQLEAKHDEEAGLERELESLRAEAERCTALIRQLQADLEALPAAPQGAGEAEKTMANRKIKDYQAQLNSYRDDLHEMERAEEPLRRGVTQMREDLKKMEGLREQRMRSYTAKVRNNTVQKAADWIAANKSRFRGEVFGPIVAEIDVPDPAHVIHVENCIPFRQWGMFITQYLEDQRLLEDQKLNIAIINFKGNAMEPIRHPRGEAQQFASWGITHTLDQMIEAPPVVKHVLCEQTRMNLIYVGNNDLNLESFSAAHKDITHVCMPTASFMSRTSDYNPSARSQSVRTYNQPSLLVGGGNDAERQELANRLAADEQALQKLHAEGAEKSAELERLDKLVGQERSELKRIDDAIKKHKDGRRKMEMKIRTTQKALETAEAKLDPQKRAQRAAEIQRAIEELREEGIATLEKWIELQKTLWEKMQEFTVKEARNRELSMQIAAIDKATANSRKEIDTIKHSIDVFTKKLEGIKADLRVQKQALNPPPDQLPPDVQEAFQSFAERSSEDLRADIVAKQEQLEGIVCSNPRVMEEFRERSRKILELEEKARIDGQKLEAVRKDMEDLKELWLPRLQSIVDQINASFKVNFREIGCAGEVFLAGPDRYGDDYAKYAIEIRVKFRDNEDLALLTATRQSGGERSVATILYLISLQGVTVCPFRVVDEINQGMDPINERKVFMQLVDAACEEDTPQCFLLTPKLLPNLSYKRNVSVLQIFNGTTTHQVVRCLPHDVRILGSRPKVD